MRRILPIACVAFAFTVGLSAQTTGTGTPAGHKTHASKAAKSSGRTVTLTGCLREGDTPGTYQLTNVDMSSMGAKSGKGTHAHGSTATSGTEPSGGQAGMGGAMGTINLVASGSVDLKEHVGHRVQVTGTWGAGHSGTAGTSGYSAEETSEQKESEQKESMGSGEKGGRELTVKSLKHLSETCQ